MGEKEILFHIFEGYFDQDWDWFCERLEKFENGKDFILENDMCLFKMIKIENDLIRAENSTIKFCYHIFTKGSEEPNFGIIFLKDNYIYELSFEENIFLSSDKDDQELLLLIYSKHSIGTNLSTNFRIDTINGDNFFESEHIQELKSLFKFLLSNKNIRLRLLLNSNSFGIKILESLNFKGE